MRIVWKIVPGVPDETQLRNIARAKSLGLPFVRQAEAWHEHPLAVIGAGPSIARERETLKAWPGDRWAINGAAFWCADNGIPATFLTIDPGTKGWMARSDAASPYPSDLDRLAALARSGMPALLCTCVDPALFDVFAGCDVRIFDLFKLGTSSGSSTATCTPFLGPLLGYREVVFFGCESSFADGLTHVNEFCQAYIDENMVVRCGDDVYATCPQMAIQSDELGKMIRAFPQIYSERSGGLLRAMVAHADYDVVSVAPALRARLKPIETMPEPRAILPGNDFVGTFFEGNRG